MSKAKTFHGRGRATEGPSVRHFTIGTQGAIFSGMNGKMKNSDKTKIRKGAIIERTEGGITTGYVVTDIRNWLVFAFTLDGQHETHIDNFEQRGVTFRMVEQGKGEVLWTSDKIAAYEALSMDERNAFFLNPTSYTL